MGNRYGPRADEFEWTLGARRRLLRYLTQAHLSYAECALLLGTSRGSVAAMTARLKLPRLTPEEARDRRRQRAYEAARHGKRSGLHDDSRYIEPWAVFSARKRAERQADRDVPAQTP